MASEQEENGISGNESMDGNTSITLIKRKPKQIRRRLLLKKNLNTPIRGNEISSQELSSDEDSAPPNTTLQPSASSVGSSKASTVSNKGKQGLNKKPQRPPGKKWQDLREGCDIEPNFPEFISQARNAQDREKFSPIDYFNQYYDKQFFKKVAENTNVHFQQIRNELLKATEPEIRSFVGISLLMSTLGFYRIRMYWSPYYRILLIADTMTRNRYFLLRNYLHVVSNLDVTEEEKNRDKLWKIRPIIDEFRRAVLLLPREENLSIDEQMIPFSGHVGIRQYVPRKPSPTGLKNYVLASSSGTILDFEIYQGKTTNFPDDTEKTNLGIGGRAVLRLSETCLPGTKMYFDRYFTSVTLLDELKNKGIAGTGTTMSNRFPNVGFPTDYEMKKLGRGTIKSKIREDKTIALIKWMDNKAITVASTIHSVQPIHHCKRYSRPDQRYVEISQPVAVKYYNENMGRVDVANRMIAAYRSYHKTRKWPVRVFEHFMDSAAVNCWFQYRQDCQDLGVSKKKHPGLNRV